MKRTSFVLLWQFGMLAGVGAFGDVVTLNDGQQVSGLITSGNTQEVRVQTEGRTEVIAVDQIRSIRFGPQAEAPPRPSTQPPPPAAVVRTPSQSAPPPAARPHRRGQRRSRASERERRAESNRGAGPGTDPSRFSRYGPGCDNR